MIIACQKLLLTSSYFYLHLTSQNLPIPALTPQKALLEESRGAEQAVRQSLAAEAEAGAQALDEALAEVDRLTIRGAHEAKEANGKLRAATKAHLRLRPAPPRADHQSLVF